jgi:hypothetical protein
MPVDGVCMAQKTVLENSRFNLNFIYGRFRNYGRFIIDKFARF